MKQRRHAKLSANLQHLTNPLQHKGSKIEAALLLNLSYQHIRIRVSIFVVLRKSSFIPYYTKITSHVINANGFTSR